MPPIVWTPAARFTTGAIRRADKKPCRLEKGGAIGNLSGHTYFLRKWNPLPNVPPRKGHGKSVVEFRGFWPRLVA
jgi:hypothetical protein